MGTENQNNRSTALTPEIAGQINADLIAAIKDAFEAGVIAGRQEVLLAFEEKIEKVIAGNNLAVTK
jgi:hypothetical protein